jgi:hypothetical protein
MNTGNANRPELTSREYDDAQRLAQILEWRRQARSYRWIGEHLGISYQRVWTLYHEALAAIKVPAVEALRQEAQERYEGLMVEMRELASRMASAERPDPVAIRQVLDSIVKTQTRLDKLYGTEAPAKVEAIVQQQIHYIVEGVDPEELK